MTDPGEGAPGAHGAIPLLDLRAQHAELAPELERALSRVMASGSFVMGAEVEAFERELQDAFGFACALGVSSGSDALLAVLMALEVGPGDEVITTPWSFFSAAGAVARVGAKPVFVDIEPETYNLDPDAVRAALTPRTRAIIAVHLYGQCCDMRALGEIAEQHGVTLIEDAAQALGAQQRGVFAGCLGDAACFSFHPTKNLGAAGDAGLVVIKDAELAERVRLFRQHGAQPKYRHHVVGGNFRMDELQAAILRVKLPSLARWNGARQLHAAFYDRALAGLPLRTPLRRAENECVFQQYTVWVDPASASDQTTSSKLERDRLAQHLSAQGIASAVFYPTPLHLQPCFAALGYAPGSLPVAEAAARSVLSLPIAPELGLGRIARVANAVRAAFDAGPVPPGDG